MTRETTDRPGDDRRDLEREVRLHELLREAGDADLDDGAAARIAEGAWRRAHATGPRIVRGGPTPPATRIPRRVLRAAWAAAAAAGLLGAFLAPRGATAAFAVEGDPVQVWRGSDWSSSRRIPVGTWAWMPPGTRTIAGPGDARIRAEPGSVLRVRPSAGGVPWRVDVRDGRVEVEGGGLEVEAGDVHVLRAPANGRFGVTVELAGAPARTVAPADPERTAAPGAPLVRMRFGTARIVLDGSADVLTLGPAERATVVRGGALAGRRLARLEEYEQVRGELVERILRGGRVVDAGDFEGAVFGVLMELGGDDLAIVEADRARLDELLVPLNAATWFTTSAGSGSRARLRVRMPEQGVDLDLDLRLPAGIGRAAVREWVHERDGVRTELRRLADGTWRLRTPEGERTFRTLDALASADPERHALFAGRLDD